MKNFTLMLFMMLLSVGGYAQLDQETFETWPVTPGNWTILQQGPNTGTWTNGLPNGPFAGVNNTGSAYVQPQNSSTVPNPNVDWLITKSFTVPTNPQLYFMSKWLQGGDQGARVDVMISNNADPSVTASYVSLIDADGWSEAEINPQQTAWTEKILVIPTTYVGQNVHIAFVYKSSNNADRWIIDNVSVSTKCQAPSNIIVNTHTSVGFNVSFNFPAGVTNYELEIVEEGQPQTGIATHTFNVAPPYTITNLLPGKIYRVYARTMCSPTNPSDWFGPQAAFTYPLGSTCGSPIEISGNNGTYQTTDNTANYPDIINGTAGATGCNGVSTSLNGNDVIYRYTASFTGPISITMTNSGTNTGLFVYDECAGIGTACLAGDTGNAASPPIIPTFDVVTGEDYYIVISTSGSTPSTAYTLTIQAVSCTPPVGQPTLNVGPTSAELSWTNPTAATTWQVVVQPQGTGLPPTNPTNAQTANTNLLWVPAPLQQATAYEYWVRSDCNNGTYSAWSGPYFFMTTQIPDTLNYNEDFEGDTFWSLVNGTQVNKWHIGTAVNNGGAKSLYVSNNGGGANAYTITTASTVHAYRDIEIPAGTNEINISFDWKSNGQTGSTDFVRVWSVPTTFNPAAGSQITAGAGRVAVSPVLQLNNDWTTANYVVNTTAYDGEIRRFVIEWRNDATTGQQAPAAIDNINMNIITCSVPSALAVTAAAIQQFQATITWNASPFGTPTYDYYLSTSDVAPTDATPATNNAGAVTTTVLPSLESSTTYYVWIRSNCGPGDTSKWIGPVSFHTLQVPAPLNYTEDFEGVHKWTFRNGTAANKWVVGTATDNGGDKSLYISNTNGATNNYDTAAASVVHAYRDLQMPPTVEQITVSFDWKGQGDANDRLRVFIVDGTYVPGVGTQITPNAQRIQLGADFNQSGNWTNSFSLQGATAFAGQVKRIIFEWRNDATGGTQPPIAVDNVNISIVTCPSPTLLVLGAVTAADANISWAGPVSITPTFDYYVSTNISNAPVAGTTPTGNVTTTNVLLDDELAGSSNFYFWVRSNCGSGDNSPWVGPLQFSLPQAPATLNYNDTLEGPINWTIVNGTQANKWVVGSATSSSASTSLYVSNNNGILNNYTTTTASTVHAYRDIQMPTAPSDIALSFQWKAAGEGVNDRLRVWIVPQAFNPIAGTAIAPGLGRTLIGEYSGNGTAWNNATAVLAETAFVGQVRRIVFEWRNNATLGVNPAAAVDNINVRIITCPAVTNLVAAGTGVIGDVILSWTPVGTETAWEIVLQPETDSAPGDNPPIVIPVTGTPSRLIENLPAGIFYNFYVRPVCSPTDKGLWAGPGQFSIFNPPACAAVQLLDEDLEVIAPGTNLSICPGEDACVELSANYLQTGATSSYAVEEIDYLPQFPFNGGIEMNVTIDDSWSPTFTFPTDFNFCFYGAKQTRMQVGSNGVVSFNANYPVAQAGSCPWIMNNNVPNTSFPIKNAILGVYQDIDPSVINDFANPSINYQILGTYPCRAVVVNFSEIAQWDLGGCEDDPTIGAQTSQIVFYEISNIVEVYVKRRVPCMDSWGGDGVIGLINASGNAGTVPAGYNVNNSGWTISEKAFRFTPNGPSNVLFEWFKGTAFYSNDADITVCVTEPTTMTARATYSGCGTTAAVIESKVTITPEQPIIITDPTDLTACVPAPGDSATFDLTQGIVNGVGNPALYTFTFYNTELEAIAGVVGTDIPSTLVTSTDKTVYVRVQLTGRSCFATDSFEVKVKVSPQFDLTPDFTMCQNETRTIAVTNPTYFDINTATYVWSHDVNGTLPDTGSSISVTDGGVYTVEVTFNGCKTTKSVIVTEVAAPTADDPADETRCDSYTLPALSPDNKYFTGSLGTGQELAVGTVISTTQTIYVYVPGAVAGCNAENSFIVTIIPTPQLPAIPTVNACQSYTLPALALGDYYDGPGGTGNLITAGTPITATQLLYVYVSVGSVPCTAETSFTVNITPEIIADTRTSATVCSSPGYELTALNANNTYHTAAGGLGQTLAPGTFITENQTVYIYAEDGDCFDETNFTITVVDQPLDVSISEGCEGGSYILGVVFAGGELNYNADNVTYAWSRTEGGTVIATTPTLVAEEEGEYFVRVTPTGSSVACYGEGQLDVLDVTCLIQRGISPNGDGKNDSFDLTAFDVRKLSIFNRYGKEVFSYGNYTNQWHGQEDGGNELPTGTYFYTMERANGENKTGWVYINREQ